MDRHLSENPQDHVDAIAYARGEGLGQNLAALSRRERDIAELGARRAIAFLRGERLTEVQAMKPVPEGVCAYPSCTCASYANCQKDSAE